MAMVQERDEKTHARAMAKLTESRKYIKKVGGGRVCLDFTIN